MSQIEVFRNGGEIIGIVIHVVTFADLRRPAAAAAIVRDNDWRASRHLPD